MSKTKKKRKSLAKTQVLKTSHAELSRKATHKNANSKSSKQRNVEDWDNDYASALERSSNKGKNKASSAVKVPIVLGKSVYQSTKDALYIASLDHAEQRTNQSEAPASRRLKDTKKHNACSRAVSGSGSVFEALVDDDSDDDDAAGNATNPLLALAPATFSLAPPKPLTDLNEHGEEAPEDDPDL